MAELIEASQRMATTDPLTGLLNRRAFSQAIDGERARAARYGHGVSIALFDIDRFKQVNDVRGHAAGDAVLSAVGNLLQQHRRETDIVGRWGGEEFIVAFTHTTLAGAQSATERLRKLVEGMTVVHEGAPIPTTASFGVAELRAGEAVDALIARADRAMYASKAGGRNRVTADLEPVKSVG